MTNKQASNLIPNIVIGQEYDNKYQDAPIHYEALDKLSVFFGHNMPVHRHAQYLQIHFIANGEVDFHIDDQVYQVQAPCCFVTPPSSPHSFRINVQAKGHVLTIHQSLIWQLLTDGLQQAIGSERIQAMCIEQKSLPNNEQHAWLLLNQSFQHIANEWQHQALAKQLALEGLVRTLIIQLVRLSSSKGHNQQHSTKVDDNDVRIFNLFSDLIEQHYCEHWFVPQYLAAIGISESRLNVICQRITKQSPKKLIHNRMVLEIKRMLAFTKMSVNDICYQTGFSDPAYFSRFFKKHSGKTALVYRKEQE